VSERISYRVWWLREAMAAERAAPCPPLADAAVADVCVVGGGYLGLWTAIEIRQQAPDARVVLIEREFCGAGGSGRNGGWVTGWFDELDGLVARFGDAEAVRLADRSHWAIDRIEAFCDEQGIDCAFRRRGALWVAGTPAELGAWDGPVAAGRRLGRPEMLEVLSDEEARRRTGSPVPLGGTRHTDAAAIQPAALVRGLRRVALELGVTIHEATPMVELVQGTPLRVITSAGHVDCDRVVLAIGAWSAGVPDLRRATVPVASHIVLTEPLGDRVADVPWAGGELLGDARLMVHYAQVTADGRIAFGRGGGALGARGHIGRRHFHDPAEVAAIARDFRRWFPALADVRLTHAWGGPVDRAPGHLPFTGRLGADGAVLYGAGFSGNGVGPSALLGRILGRQALGVVDADTTSTLTTGPPSLLPPEPLRSAGGALVRRAVERVERGEEEGRTAPRARRVLRRLVAAHTPTALDPRLARLRRAAGSAQAGKHATTTGGVR
jgi:glycine/D-amino acid oxidase-like deaminating enzyme